MTSNSGTENPPVVLDFSKFGTPEIQSFLKGLEQCLSDVVEPVQDSRFTLLFENPVPDLDWNDNIFQTPMTRLLSKLGERMHDTDAPVDPVAVTLCKALSKPNFWKQCLYFMRHDDALVLRSMIKAVQQHSVFVFKPEEMSFLQDLVSIFDAALEGDENLWTQPGYSRLLERAIELNEEGGPEFFDCVFEARNLADFELTAADVEALKAYAIQKQNHPVLSRLTT